MEKTTTTAQKANVQNTNNNTNKVKVTREQVVQMCEMFKTFACGDFETISYRLKEIAFCIGQCDKGTNELKHLFTTLQDIDSIMWYLLADDLRDTIFEINRTEPFTKIEIEVTE